MKRILIAIAIIVAYCYAAAPIFASTQDNASSCSGGTSGTLVGTVLTTTDSSSCTGTQNFPDEYSTHLGVPQLTASFAGYSGSTDACVAVQHPDPLDGANVYVVYDLGHTSAKLFATGGADYRTNSFCFPLYTAVIDNTPTTETITPTFRYVVGETNDSSQCEQSSMYSCFDNAYSSPAFFSIATSSDTIGPVQVDFTQLVLIIGWIGMILTFGLVVVLVSTR